MRIFLEGIYKRIEVISNWRQWQKPVMNGSINEVYMNEAYFYNMNVCVSITQYFYTFLQMQLPSLLHRRRPHFLTLSPPYSVFNNTSNTLSTYETKYRQKHDIQTSLYYLTCKLIKKSCDTYLCFNKLTIFFISNFINLIDVILCEI